MTHSNIDTPLELKFLAETGVFEGYASVFNVVDSVNDKIMPGAFKESLLQFRKSGRHPPLLWQHNSLEPIGAWQEMYEDAHGLFVKGSLFINDIPLAKEAYKLLRENVVTGLSIGYRTKESARDQKSGVRLLTKLDLLEVSLVTFPANEHARVSGVKSSAAIERLKNLMLQAAEEMKAAAARSPAADRLIASIKKATAENLIKAGFNPSQPRAPQGTSTGGQWTDSGGGSGRSGSRRVLIPKLRPQRAPTMEELRRYEGDGLGHPLSPFDFIGGGGALRTLKPVAREAVGAATAARNAARVKGYLEQARKIPKGIKETGKGIEKLTNYQIDRLKSFRKKHSKFKDSMEIIHYSDGRTLFSVKHASKNIPGSFTVWEKQVDAAGNVIRTNKTTIGSKGELVHIKPY